MLDVTLCGTGGTTPRIDRHLSSAYLRHDGHGLLIDCGEGTQIAVKKANMSLSRVGLILLTHFHGDHVAGLPGFLLTMGNEGRREKVTICGPRGVAEIVKALTVCAQELPFSIDCVPMGDFDTVTYKDFNVTSFEVHHTCPCLGYDIRIHRGGKFDPDKAKANEVPMKYWKTLQKGEAIDGFTPDMVMGERRRGLHVTYSTDTRPTEILSTMATDADLLITEAMFGENKKEDRAKETCHMTLPEAAVLAKEAAPRRLWLTHYSPSMPEPELYTDALEKLYPGARLGYDGMTETLRFEDEQEVLS